MGIAAGHAQHGTGGSGSPGTAPGGDVAILIDFENLKWSLYNRFQMNPSLGSLVEVADAFGRLVVARAYADWTDARLRVDAATLYTAGIEPIYVPSGMKNSADVRMAVDAVDLCARFAGIGTFILVTGDQDLIHALHYLRMQGRRVVVLGVGYATSTALSTQADALLIYERDIEPLTPQAREAPIVSLSPEAPDLPQALEMIEQALRDGGSDGPMPLGKLYAELRTRHGFNARRWYGRPFRTIVEKAAEAGLLVMRQRGGYDYAALPDAAQPQLEPPTAAVAQAEQETGQRAVRVGFGQGLDALPREVQERFLRFLIDLQARSDYMTFKYIVDNLTYHAVFPGMAAGQVSEIVNAAADEGLLDRRQAFGEQPGGVRYEYNTFSVNAENARARALLVGPPDAKWGPLHVLLPRLAEEGSLRMDDLVVELMATHGEALRAMGYAEARSYLLAAAEEGLVDVVPLPDGEYVYPISELAQP